MSLTLMEQPGGLLVVDADSRLYLARRRTTERWHVIQPAEEHQQLVADGKKAVGQLTCTCPGGLFHGRCWATKLAEGFERSINDELRWGIKNTGPAMAPSGRVIEGPQSAQAPDAPERASAQPTQLKKTTPGEASGRVSRARSAAAASPNPAHRSKGTTGQLVASGGHHL